METKEGPRAKAKVEKLEVQGTGVEKPACTLCGRPASQLVDGEPSCEDHIEQIYEHQVEDYTRKHLSNTPWREV
jgi:hypothetical protein